MDIQVNNLSKRFGFEWIFEDLSFHFESGHYYAITGSNGSGKSSLIKILCGSLGQSKGSVVYSFNGEIVSQEKLYKNISICAPYLELIEEFTLTEMIDYHFRFKSPILPNLDELPELFQLKGSEKKAVKQFSSGMKQRLKLGLAVFSDNPLVLLDEPCSNLDQKGIDWYQTIIRKYQRQRTFIIASNQAFEYEICSAALNIENYKDQK